MSNWENPRVGEEERGCNFLKLRYGRRVPIKRFRDRFLVTAYKGKVIVEMSGF